MATKKERSIKECREEFKAKVAHKKKKIKALSQDELQAHMDRVRDVYQTKHKADKLGNFDWDPTYKYHWNTYDDGDFSDKLTKRVELGWGYATLEDAKKSGLADEKVNNATIDGETCVEMSHKNCKAVLLKIHRDLYNLNTKIREDVEKERLSTDAQGHDVSVNKVDNGQSTVVHHTENASLLD